MTADEQTIRELHEGFLEANNTGDTAFLYEHMVQPEYTVRHRWSQGDVGFWDNTRTMHYAVADYGSDERIIHRVTVEGERPV